MVEALLQHLLQRTAHPHLNQPKVVAAAAGAARGSLAGGRGDNLQSGATQVPASQATSGHANANARMSAETAFALPRSPPARLSMPQMHPEPRSRRCAAARRPPIPSPAPVCGAQARHISNAPFPGSRRGGLGCPCPAQQQGAAAACWHAPHETSVHLAGAQLGVHAGHVHILRRWREAGNFTQRGLGSIWAAGG